MSATLNETWAATLVGALVRGGLRHVVICPGSRSTPLTLAFAARKELQCWPVMDERSAAFFALGLSKATGVAAAVVCTSGTAGAHFLPAVMEASESGIPLIVITADRPWSLHGFGAPQTIHQVGLFGRYVRSDKALPSPSEADLAHLAVVVAQVAHEAHSTPRGAVHLNVPFAEPLAPATGSVPCIVDPILPRFLNRRATVAGSGLRTALLGAERGVILCGPRAPEDTFGSWIHAVGEKLGFPVLAEAASNVRFGFPDAISTVDILVRNTRFVAQMKPDVVLRFGGALTDKHAQAWLDGCGARVFQVMDDAALFDPQHKVEEFVPFETAERVLNEVVQHTSTTFAAKQWCSQWQLAQQRVLKALRNERPIWSEALIARACVQAVPEGSSLFVSSSMPIRDVDAFAVEGPAIRVFVNRGVNGIDGITSTALGVAAATVKPTLLLVGDVALLHDLSAWILAKQNRISLTALIVNNDGGGIFHFLPVAGASEHFEAFFGTPHGVDLKAVAALSGAQWHRVSDLGELAKTLPHCLSGGLHLIEARTSRLENVEQHQALFARLVEVVS